MTQAHETIEGAGSAGLVPGGSGADVRGDFSENINEGGVDIALATVLAAQPGAMATFRSWAGNLPDERRLSASSVKCYEQIWTPWLRFLVHQRLRWDEATDMAVRRFLETPGAASKRRAEASHVTVRRYWRVLREIYEHAVEAGLVASTPVTEGNQPAMMELARPAAIGPAQLAQLRARLPRGTPGDALELRDAAMLAVLVDVGPTTRELIDLTTSSVGSPAGRGCLVLRLSGPRKVQHRELVLSRRASSAVMRWLACRANLAAPAEQLFISMRGHCKLEPTDVLHVVNVWLGSVVKTLDLGHVDRLGANSLRTAVLLWWRDVEQMTVNDLLARAGLREKQALRRLLGTGSGT